MEVRIELGHMNSRESTREEMLRESWPSGFPQTLSQTSSLLPPLAVPAEG